MDFKVPKEVNEIANGLTKAGYEAYLVGGCVRDLIMKCEPKDWDITTSAEPEKIQEIFPESVYENDFGTVGVKTGSDDETLKIVEVTTFRLEGKYTDKRHPDEIKFAKNVEDDLDRRDFTINAIALDLNSKNGKLIDQHGGLNDISQKVISTVGDPGTRFEEDALRLMRAVRLAAQLGFEIEHETARAIRENAGLLEMIAKERVRDELTKMIMTPRAAEGIILLEDLGLLRYVIPELREGIAIGQNKHHIYTVFDHNVRALNYTAEKGYSLEVRLAALLHDVGKPKSKRGEGIDSTFYSHEVIGARMATKIVDRLRFSKEIAGKVIHLVRHHLFYYNVGEVTEAGVRRFLARVGPENIDDLIKVREADRIGSGVPKAAPYKIRHLLFMIEKVKHDPLHPKMLALDGNELMKLLDVKPGPHIGMILMILLEDVLDDPTRNTKEYLTIRATELGKLPDAGLKKKAEEAKSKKDEANSAIEGEMKKKYYVQ
ncbi:MAG: HD domain-containing protein [Candidatus Jorgensenbacteria bacterium]|nr:HD domain-containing protein [Candidatus Jorgensenbacteria bacterium]